MSTREPAIAAVFELKPGKYPDEDAYGMYRLAISGAINAWGLRPSDIDGFLSPPLGVTGGGEVDTFTHQRFAEELGIQPRFAETLQAGGATGGMMLGRAAAAVRDGAADAVLCVQSGKFPKVSAGGGEIVARAVSHPDYEMVYGAFIPALYAIAGSQYLATYGFGRQEIAQVSVAQRKWALLNPDAIARAWGAITVEDVLTSRPIAHPFHLLDCSVPCEGGGIFLVTTSENARRYGPRHVLLRGYGELHTHEFVSQARDVVPLGAKRTGDLAFRQAGLERSDIDVAMLYDAFSVNPLMLLEDLGFCKPGTAPEFVADGATSPGGRLPVNTNGGLLSFGHVGDASGFSVLIEAVKQITATAGERQVEGAERALVHVYGGIMAEHVTLILEASR